MPLGNATLQPPNGGIDIPTKKLRGTNRTGATLSKGDLVAFDLDMSLSESNNLIGGAEDSGLFNLRTPTAQDLISGCFAVLGDVSLEDGKVGEFIYQGLVVANQQKNTGDIAAGDPLFPAITRVLDADATAGHKIIAKNAAGLTGPSAGATGYVIFSGIFPLGVHV